MATPKLRAVTVPTPGPWVVRGEAGEGAPARDAILGVEPATEDSAGGWPYLIREDREFAPGDTPLHLATGLQRLAVAQLMAAAPALAAALLRLLTAPPLTRADLDSVSPAVSAAAWSLLVRVAPHLEVWPDDPPLPARGQH